MTVQDLGAWGSRTVLVVGGALLARLHAPNVRGPCVHAHAGLGAVRAGVLT